MMTWSRALLDVVSYMLRSTAAAAAAAAAVWSHTPLVRRRLAVSDPHDVIAQSTSASALPPIVVGEGRMPRQSSGSCNEACDAGGDDATSPSDVSMTRGGGCHDDDVTSYSVLSTSDVSQLLQASVIDDDHDQCRLTDELRDISRDLADIRACALTVSARCHDDKWRRGDALTLGVTEALTPHAPARPAAAWSRDSWADMSAVIDWRLDESALDYESRGVVVADRKLSLTRASAADVMMTSSPADDDSVAADFYIDDELGDVIV